MGRSGFAQCQSKSKFKPPKSRCQPPQAHPVGGSVGKFVAATIKSPELSFGKALKVQSFVVTPNEVLAEYEKQTESKWDVIKTPLDEIRALEMSLWAQAEPQATLVTLRRIWAEGGTLYAENDNAVLEPKLERLDTLEDAVKKALAGGYKNDTF